jgi:hypothetical protein
VRLNERPFIDLANSWPIASGKVEIGKVGLNPLWGLLKPYEKSSTAPNAPRRSGFFAAIDP